MNRPRLFVAKLLPTRVVSQPSRTPPSGSNGHIVNIISPEWSRGISRLHVLAAVCTEKVQFDTIFFILGCPLGKKGENVAFDFESR